MQAVEVLRYALRLRAKWPDEAPSLTFHVDGKLIMEGNLNAFTNPAIEAGLLHCRALLEFLGLCDRKGVLCNIEKRHKGDVGIEQFKDANGSLKMVDPAAVLTRYGGGRTEAEKALLSIFHLTNKGLAHTTSELNEHPEQAKLLAIAVDGIPKLVASYVYTPLQMEPPAYKLTMHPKSAADH
jgi:hypothetical protein